MVGGGGTGGDIFLFRTNGDQSDLTTATIRLNGNTGDITLQNADVAEDFEIDEAEPESIQLGSAY